VLYFILTEEVIVEPAKEFSRMLAIRVTRRGFPFPSLDYPSLPTGAPCWAL
jgi:hypothetical protein